MQARQAWKWTGGKGQLLAELHSRLDPLLDSGKIERYAEPFIGAGSLMWSVLNRGDVGHVYFGDMNGEMINLYKAIKDTPEELGGKLAALQSDYMAKGEEGRSEMFYAKRNAYNALIDKHPDAAYTGQDAIESAALFMFLNRTCFNGLYRVNKSNHFNAPFGKYKNPPIDQSEQILANSEALNAVEDLTIAFAPYEDSLPFVDDKTFVYLDPPYRPLTDSASFTAYAKSGFNDDNQRELARYCRQVDERGGKFMLSNSDPHNSDPDDDFFDDLYEGFTIERVLASRAINSKGDGRGKITEILVRNF